MDNKEAIQMMERCADEIKTLREQIRVLSPKADAYDTIHEIVGLLPKHSQGYGEDLVWLLKKKIAELQPKPEVKPDAKPSESPIQ